jgi:hypothetical protein
MTTEQLDILIDDCQRDMLNFYNIQVSRKKAEEFIINNDVETFDTWERETFVNEIAMKIANMPWPCNGDSDEYKKEFDKKFWNA